LKNKNTSTLTDATVINQQLLSEKALFLCKRSVYLT